MAQVDERAPDGDAGDAVASPNDGARNGAAAASAGDQPPREAGRAPRRSLSDMVHIGLPGKLLVLTVVFVMLAEILIFVPSIANFRVTWLTARLTSARLASLAALAVPGGKVPAEVKQELLNTAQVRAVAIKREMTRRLVLPSDTPLSIDASFDLRRGRAHNVWEAVGNRLALIRDALWVFFAPEGRVIRVYGRPSSGLDNSPPRDEFVEIVLPEAPLRAAMIQYGLNILGLSVIISIIAAALVYFALNRVLVQPMMRLSRNMMQFSEMPEDPGRVITPSGRGDEIGAAEHALNRMQTQLLQLLQQRNRLAQLGLAVSKINHDLRNMLASAQLMSDRLAGLPDPTVQRFAPKLIASLDRAIDFCNSTLKFGRAEEPPLRRDLFPLLPLVEEVGGGLDLPRATIAWSADIEPGLQVDADHECLYRVLNNICRNAIQALESRDSDDPGAIDVTAHREGRRVVIEIADNGPGIPERVRANLFQAFQGGARRGGSGLGLAIAAELVRAHGGDITHVDTPVGALFRIVLPDRRVGVDA